MADAASLSFLDRHHFLIRRLHSLTGIVPIGIFLINHMLTNYTMFEGPDHFDKHVHWIHALPMLLMIEIFGIFLPIAFHAALGVYIALQGKSNTASYPYMDNWRYSLQRITAWIALIFLIIHFPHFRFAHWLGGEEYKAAAEISATAVTARGFQDLLIPMWLWMVIYVVGLLASVFHFCNGIVTFCITWGLTLNTTSRQYVSYGASGLGVVLVTWGLLGLYAIAIYDEEAHLGAKSHDANAAEGDPDDESQASYEADGSDPAATSPSAAAGAYADPSS